MEVLVDDTRDLLALSRIGLLFEPSALLVGPFSLKLEFCVVFFRAEAILASSVSIFG